MPKRYMEQFEDDTQTKRVKYGRLVAKTKLEKFKTNLNNFEQEINNLLNDLTNREILSNEKFLKIRNDIQLTAELKIAGLKQENGFDINIEDESKLPLDLNNKIKQIQDRNIKLIERVDPVEEEINKKLSQNQIKINGYIEEINLLKKLLLKWKNHLEEMNGIDQFSLNLAEKELNQFETEELTISIDKLTMSKFEINFIKYGDKREIDGHKVQVENELDLGHIETMKSSNIDIFKNIELTGLVDEKHQIKLARIQLISNRKCFIEYDCRRKKFLSIYDLFEDKVLAQIEFEPKIDQIFILSNKILILIQSKSFDEPDKLILFDMDLNIVYKEELNKKTKLIGTDYKSSIYFIDDNFGVICYNFLLENETNLLKMKKKETKLIEFNFDENEEPFRTIYVPDSISELNFRIIHLKILDELYIVIALYLTEVQKSIYRRKYFKSNFDPYFYSFLFYNKNGELINVSQTCNGLIQMNSKKDLIITYGRKTGNNFVAFTDLNGELQQIDYYETEEDGFLIYDNADDSVNFYNKNVNKKKNKRRDYY